MLILISCAHAQGGTVEHLLQQVICTVGAKDALGISGARVFFGRHSIQLVGLCNIITHARSACLGVHSHSLGLRKEYQVVLYMRILYFINGWSGLYIFMVAHIR